MLLCIVGPLSWTAGGMDKVWLAPWKHPETSGERGSTDLWEEAGLAAAGDKVSRPQAL